MTSSIQPESFPPALSEIAAKVRDGERLSPRTPPYASPPRTCSTSAAWPTPCAGSCTGT